MPFHLAALERLDRTRLVGVVSSSADRAAAVTQQWGGRAFGSVDELLDVGAPEAVLVCLPPHRSAAACRRLVERGIPFLTEKPLAADRADVDEVLAALRERPRLVAAVGYQWRALDVLPAVRARVERWPPELILGRWTGTLPGPPWWRRNAEGGGQVVEQATHLFDLARVLVGEAEVVAAASVPAADPDDPDADVDRAAAAVVRFRSGAVGAFSSTWLLASSKVALELLAPGHRTVLAMETTPDGPRWRMVIDDGEVGGEQVVAVERDPYEVQAEAFLDAVAAGDPLQVLATYADAARTDALARAVTRAGRAAPRHK